MRFLLASLVLSGTLFTGSHAVGLPQAEQVGQARVLVAYHSDTGHTETMARALAEGMARVRGVEVTLRPVDEVEDEEILQADGIAVGTPVHWGSLSVPVKTFLDRVGVVLDAELHGEGRTAGAFCTGGAVSSGKELARLAILAAFLNLRFLVVGGIAPDGYGNLGPQATTGPEDPGLSEAELDEARQSGERFARITKQFKQSQLVSP